MLNCYIFNKLTGSTRKDKELEERRLFYVAITRGIIQTDILYSSNPSKYVKEIEFIQGGITYNDPKTDHTDRISKENAND